MGRTGRRAQRAFHSFSKLVSRGSMADARLGTKTASALSDTLDRAACGVLGSPSVHHGEQINGAPSTRWNVTQP